MMILQDHDNICFVLCAQKLLQKVGEQHVRQPSADSSGCSSGQESVTSSLTADSQVSGDSGTEVDQVPVLPDKLLEGLSTWESSSLRQRNVSITRPNAPQTAHWGTYVKAAKSGEPILGETVSLARSTPNLTDSTGYTTSQHTWSSTGYISMPSSEELSSNPSPVPKENPNVNAGSGGGDGGSGGGGGGSIGNGNGEGGSDGDGSGGYSVVGSVPKPIRIKSEDGATMTDTVADALIPVKPETKRSANPYVALAALEQKSKEKKKQPAIDTFRDLDNLTFVDSGKCTTLDSLTPHFNTVSQQISQPYVQTGLIDTLQKPFVLNPIDHMRSNPTCNSFAPTTLTDSCGKPFMSPFVVSSTSSQGVSNTLAETISLTKPYVTVSIPEMTKSSASVADGKEPSSRRLYIRNYGPAPKDASSKPYVLASSIQRILQQQQRGKTEPSTNVAEDEGNEDETCPALPWQKIDDVGEKEPSIKLDSPTDRVTPVIAKQNTGYVTIIENSNREHQGSIVTTAPSSHERSEKPPPPSPQTATGQSTDEQYSKVTVVPSTI